MPKPYHLMTSEERLARTVEINRGIEARTAPVLAAQQAVSRVRNQRAVVRAVKQLDKALAYRDGYGLPERFLVALGAKKNG